MILCPFLCFLSFRHFLSPAEAEFSSFSPLTRGGFSFNEISAMFAPKRGPHQTPGNILRGWKAKGVRRWSLSCSSAHPVSLGYHLCLTRFSLPLTSTFLLVVIGSEPTFTSTQTHFPSFSVPAKWGPCTLPPVHPLRSGPSRLLLKVLSFNHFFKKVFFFFFLQGRTRSQITSVLLSDSVTI